MSSILEALERAERDRKPIEKLDFLETGKSSSISLLRRREIWVFGGILLLINLLLWQSVITTDDPESKTGKAASVDSQPPRRTKERPLSTDSVVSFLQSESGEGRGSVPPLLAEAVVTKKSTTSPAPAAGAAANLNSPAAPRAEPQTLPPAAAPEEGEQEGPTVREQPHGDSAARVEGPAIQAKAAVATTATDTLIARARSPQREINEASDAASAVDAFADVPRVWELPANLQQKLSDLKINIHVFNAEPSQRFVIINMQKYREGDRLEPYGMQLEHITREGIVINHGDGLVRM